MVFEKKLHTNPLDYDKRIMYERVSKLPEILEKDKTLLVEQLLSYIHQQAEEIQKIKDEIARLKNQPPRPKIKPSNLEKNKTNK
jgi:hypothetical protein